jgi:hypothetical protein
VSLHSLSSITGQPWQNLLEVSFKVLKGRWISDSHHFDSDADPDPAFHFNAEPNPTFHFNADPDYDPHQGDANLRSLAFRHPGLHFEPPRLHFVPSKLQNFDFIADPDPASKNNADPDPKPWYR